MSKLLIVLLGAVFFFNNAFAASKEDLRKKIYEAMATCDQAVFTDDNYLVLSLPLKANQPTVRLVDFNRADKPWELTTKTRVVDMKIRGDILYVLTQTSLEAWIISTQKQLFSYMSHPYLSLTADWRQLASGFILNGNQAIISHGTLGASVLDLNAGMFVKLLKMPTLSSAQDIASVNANTAVLAIDNDAQSQFRGMYLMDLNSLEFTKQIVVDNAFPSSVRVLDKNRLMMIYFNAVWKFDLETALKSNEALPQRRAWKFPNMFLVDMIGKVAFDKKNLYACFHLMDEKTGARKVRPMAIDLESIQLN